MFWHTATKELPEEDGEYLIIENDGNDTKSIANFAQRLEFGNDNVKVNRFNVFYTYDNETGYRFRAVKSWAEIK